MKLKNMNKIKIDLIKNLFEQNHRLDNSSKYDFGHVLIIAGSIGMLGANVLASRAAMRSGSGLITSAVPNNLIFSIMHNLIEQICLCVPSQNNFFDLSSFDFLNNFIRTKKISAVVIGPGIGREEATISFVKKMIEVLIDLEIPTIIDADALYSLSNSLKNNLSTNLSKVNNFEIDIFTKTSKIKNIIITPHEQEMSKLINAENIDFIKNNREYCCQTIAESNGVTCVLKGKNSLISDGLEVFVNMNGNSGMATAGSGDVLSGILASFQGQYKSMNMVDVAKLGVFVHALSGDIARENLGEHSMIASDIIHFLPNAFKTIFK